MAASLAPVLAEVYFMVGKVGYSVWYSSVFSQQGSGGSALCIQGSINQNTSLCEIHSGLGDNKIIMFSGFSSPFYFLQLQCSFPMHFYCAFWIKTKMIISEIPIWISFKGFTYNTVCWFIYIYIMQMRKDDKTSKRCLVRKYIQ